MLFHSPSRWGPPEEPRTRSGTAPRFPPVATDVATLRVPLEPKGSGAGVMGAPGLLAEVLDGTRLSGEGIRSGLPLGVYRFGGKMTKMEDRRKISPSLHLELIVSCRILARYASRDFIGGELGESRFISQEGAIGDFVEILQHALQMSPGIRATGPVGGGPFTGWMDVQTETSAHVSACPSSSFAASLNNLHSLILSVPVIHLVVRMITWASICWTYFTGKTAWYPYMVVLQSFPEVTEIKERRSMIAVRGCELDMLGSA
eukprot:1344310-Amorphochlora_amoeboformis.AAC.1